MKSDVCLVLEGSYPYVRGGVGAWVQELVSGLPEVSFSVAHLRDEDDPVRPAVYDRPANLVELRTLDTDPARTVPGRDVVEQLPDARLYHALSTGLAGLAGAEAADSRRRPFLLTEHGLAWREAALGISGCKPHIAGCKPHRAARRMSREEWVGFVEASARHAYARADMTTTVCRANLELQRRQGAAPNRLRLIENGVARTDRSRGLTPVWKTSPLIAFVGRVVAIKDVETFLRACSLVADELPAAEFAVVGPLDHEPEYAEACVDLAADLGLGDKIRFTGETETAPWYEKLDVVVLTSLSEAQPLVLLEAMAAGVPVVSTAVGGCPELVAGAGLLTPVRDPRATAQAILRFCGDAPLRERLVQAGLDRVRRRHSREGMLGSYRDLYESLAESA
jgi:glycosyltransferase involved in cell wall biosynthesis